MEEKVRWTYLYDFYGELLPQKQREIFENVVFWDMSLGELADELSVSRQAVHERVRRCVRAMEEYEKKLSLIEKYNIILEIKAEIVDEIENTSFETAGKKEQLLAKVDELAEVL